MITKEQKIARATKRLERVKAFKEQVENMSSCHIVTNPIEDVINGVPSFLPSGDSFCSGIDAAGDWNEGFKEVKEGIVKYAKIHLEWAEESLEREINA